MMLIYAILRQYFYVSLSYLIQIIFPRVPVTRLKLTTISL